MSDRIVETPTEHVTIVKESSRGSGGGILVALIALVVIAAIAFWAINNANRTSPSDASISAAADKVGTAAQKVGNAAEDAVKKIN